MSNETKFFNSPIEFSLYIEKLSVDTKKPCTETILDYCADRFIDIEDISGMISPQLKEKLAVEFIKSGMLPKVNTL